METLRVKVTVLGRLWEVRHARQDDGYSVAGPVGVSAGCQGHMPTRKSSRGAATAWFIATPMPMPGAGLGSLPALCNDWASSPATVSARWPGTAIAISNCSMRSPVPVSSAIRSTRACSMTRSAASSTMRATGFSSVEPELIGLLEKLTDRLGSVTTVVVMGDASPHAGDGGSPEPPLLRGPDRVGAGGVRLARA